MSWVLASDVCFENRPDATHHGPKVLGFAMIERCKCGDVLVVTTGKGGVQVPRANDRVNFALTSNTEKAKLSGVEIFRKQS